MFKVKYGNTGILREICPELTLNTAEQRHEQRQLDHCSGVLIVYFEQLNACWDKNISNILTNVLNALLSLKVTVKLQERRHVKYSKYFGC